MGHDPGEVVRLDGAGLRAIAHPLRARLLARLRSDGAATASGLAAHFGTNSGQTSYHLRVLADAGLVREDTERGTARERWWSAAHRSSSIDAADHADDPVAREQLRWLRAEAAALHDRLFARWVDEADGYGPAWASAAGMSDWVLHLTAAEAAELQRRVAEVVDEYVHHPADRDGVEQVVTVLRVFPQRELDWR